MYINLLSAHQRPELMLLLLIEFINYSAILRSRADSLRSRVILHEQICFTARFEYPCSSVLEAIV